MEREQQDPRPAQGARIDVALAPPDRSLQDRVIHYLTEANLRSENENPDFLDANEVERAKHFSHFLARRYYRDRLRRGFRYSTVLLGSDAAANLVDTPKFDPILHSCTLGSLATAKMVGELTILELREKSSDEW